MITKVIIQKHIHNVMCVIKGWLALHMHSDMRAMSRGAHKPLVGSSNLPLGIKPAERWAVFFVFRENPYFGKDNR